MLSVLTRFLPSSFRSRLALLFGLLSLLVGSPTYYYLSSVHRQQLIVERQEHLQALATAAATVFAENLVERRREIVLLASTPLYLNAPLDSPEFPASLERLKESYPQYSWLGLADNDGRVRAATSGHLTGVDVRQRPWFSFGRQAVFAGDLHEALLLAKLFAVEGQGGPMRFIDFSAPVFDAQGALKGVLGAHIHWRWAAEVMRVVMPANREEIGLDMFIVNRVNQIIYPENADPSTRVPAAAAASGKEVRPFHDWGDEQAFLTASATVREPVAGSPLHWRIVVRQPEAVVLASVNRLQDVVLAVTLIGGLVFLLLAWLAASGISRPLERLTERARRLEQGDETVSFDMPGGSAELRRLSAALQGMSGKLLDSKHFLESKVAERTAELQRLNRELETLARTDALTGVANRLAGNERLQQEFARFRRSGEGYALLLMDIDHFKRVNDTYGHATGDLVLRHVASVVGSALRETDFMARVGGEEFMVLLPLTGLTQAQGVAEKVRAAVCTAPVLPIGEVAVSIGVATVSVDDGDADIAVVRADSQLYRAKAAGRNCVMPQPEG